MRSCSPTCTCEQTRSRSGIALRGAAPAPEISTGVAAGRTNTWHQAGAVAAAARNRRIAEPKLGPREYQRAAADIAKLTWQTTPARSSCSPPAPSSRRSRRSSPRSSPPRPRPPSATRSPAIRRRAPGAITFVIVTAGASVSLLTGWRSLEQYVQRLMRYALEAKVSDIMYERFLSLEFWRYDDKDTIDIYDRAQRFSQFYAMAFNSLARMVSQVITLVAEHHRAAAWSAGGSRSSCWSRSSRHLPAVPPLPRADPALEPHRGCAARRRAPSSAVCSSPSTSPNCASTAWCATC